VNAQANIGWAVSTSRELADSLRRHRPSRQRETRTRRPGQLRFLSSKRGHPIIVAPVDLLTGWISGMSLSDMGEQHLAAAITLLGGSNKWLGL
jgi:hypothetical protein